MSYVSKKPLAIPVPFLRRTVGVGDIVAAGTRAVGIKPCAPCKERQKRLNAWLKLRPLR
jgi:hypothetical protein